jgi:acyl-CoA thioester hydrolase
VTRSRIFSKRFPVPPEAIDMQGHVSNLAYVGWMQDVAIEHSAAAGWSMPRYLELGAGWVVRSHFIEYFRPAFADEIVSVHTWVPRFDQRSTPRRYLFLRDADRVELAGAETIWVFVDLKTGRRRPIPAELLAAFEAIPEEIEVRRALGLTQ